MSAELMKQFGIPKINYKDINPLTIKPFPKKFALLCKDLVSDIQYTCNYDKVKTKRC